MNNANPLYEQATLERLVKAGNSVNTRYKKFLGYRLSKLLGLKANNAFDPSTLHRMDPKLSNEARQALKKFAMNSSSYSPQYTQQVKTILDQIKTSTQASSTHLDQMIKSAGIPI